MVSFVISLLAFLLTLFILVSLHEWGHFITARWLNVDVLRFSIGLGRPIWRYTSPKSGVEYAIGYLPLGGYVKLADEREGNVAENRLPWAFNRQKAWRRFLIVIAGPVMSVVLGILAYWLMFLVGLEVVKPVIGQVKPSSIAAQAGVSPNDEIAAIDGYNTPSWQAASFRIIRRIGHTGTMTMTTQTSPKRARTQHTLNLKHWTLNPLEPNPLKALGVVPYRPKLPPQIHAVKAGSPADQAGLAKGDRILKVGGQPIKNGYALIERLRPLAGETLLFTIRRNGVVKKIPVTIGQKGGWVRPERGYVGVQYTKPKWAPSMKRTRQYGVTTSLIQSLKRTGSMITFNYVMLGKLVTGDLSFGSLGGPIAIFKASSMAFIQGIAVYLNFLAMISIMLAVLNTLPIPGLDGGHLLLLAIEKIIRRPLSIALEGLLYRLGFIALIVLLVHASINDLTRMVN